MRDQRSRCSSNGDHPVADPDRATRQGVLIHAIDLHPVHVTVSELIREMVNRPGDWNERDGIERAVRDLAGVGLLHRQEFRNRDDALVAPTRAALVANEVLMDEWEEDED